MPSWQQVCQRTNEPCQGESRNSNYTGKSHPSASCSLPRAPPMGRIQLEPGQTGDRSEVRDGASAQSSASHRGEEPRALSPLLPPCNHANCQDASCPSDLAPLSGFRRGGHPVCSEPQGSEHCTESSVTRVLTFSLLRTVRSDMTRHRPS